MAWTALTYALNSLLTAAKMTQNQDNFTALAQGLSGAPKILDAAIDSTGITTRSKLPTALAYEDESNSFASSGQQTFRRTAAGVVIAIRDKDDAVDVVTIDDEGNISVLVEAAERGTRIKGGIYAKDFTFDSDYIDYATEFHTAPSGTKNADGFIRDVSGTASVNQSALLGGQVQLATGSTSGSEARISVESVSALLADLGTAEYRIWGGVTWPTSADTLSIFGIFPMPSTTVNDLRAAGSSKGVFFRKESGGTEANIFAVNKNGASETTTDCGVKSGDHFEVVATSSSIKFYIDGVLKATQTTNIPLGSLNLGVGIRNNNGNNRTMHVDWIKARIPGAR